MFESENIILPESLSGNYPLEKTKLSNFLRPETIIVDLVGQSKQAVIDELIGVMDAAGLLLDRSQVREAVIERERKLSTGLGNGIAVPHGKTIGVERLVGAFGIHRTGISFDAADGAPAKLFFMLVSPKSVSGPHVKALAAVAKFMRNERNREIIFAAKTTEEVFSIFDKKG
ncbi:PTS sugar transporter subunit IIA [bacterium]|nr:PTS sugar transporter subunit IIA [bacterium]